MDTWSALWSKVLARTIRPIEDVAAVFKSEYDEVAFTLRGGAEHHERAAAQGASLFDEPNLAPAHANRTAGPRLRVVSATPHHELNTLLSKYAYTDDGGWTGADSTYLRRLPEDKHVFMFSDTFLGQVGPNGSRARDTPFVSNSLVLVERDGTMRTVLGAASDGARRAALPPKGEQFHWLGGSHVTGRNTLDVMFLGFTGDSRALASAPDFDAERLRVALIPGGAGELDFKENLLVRFDAGDLRRLDVTRMPSDTGVHWASWVEFDHRDNHTYVYGVDDRGRRSSCTRPVSRATTYERRGSSLTVRVDGHPERRIRRRSCPVWPTNTVCRG
ncbi:hypothetical protein AB0H60_16935 [Nocardia rhamnosiphila]|uniref:hypothetical protein n=1 Tax=Nocardia rhamnosiphila TaxID=426716 RepID=UPI0033CC9BA4